MTWIEPLNLQYLLVNTFSGSTILFTILSIIAIASLAAYFRMSNSSMLLMTMIYLLMMTQWIGSWLIIPIIVIGVILSYHAMSKLWE